MKKIKIIKSNIHGFKLDEFVEVNEHQASVLVAIGAGEVVQEEKKVEPLKSARSRKTASKKAE